MLRARQALLELENVERDLRRLRRCRRHPDASACTRGGWTSRRARGGRGRRRLRAHRILQLFPNRVGLRGELRILRCRRSLDGFA